MPIQALVYFSFGIASLVLALVIFLNPTMLSSLDSNLRTMFIAMFVVYGVFRMYSGIRAIRKKSSPF